jgi:hypothetical protein
MPKERSFNVEGLPKHLRQEALQYLLHSRKATWKATAIQRLEHHRDNGFKAKATTFHRGQEMQRRVICEEQQRMQFTTVMQEKINLVQEELVLIQQRTEEMRTGLVNKLSAHVRQEREEAYIIMGINPANVGPEQRQRNDQLIQEDVFQSLAVLGKQLVRVRVETNEELQKWRRHQDERAAQRQALIQLDGQPAQAQGNRPAAAARAPQQRDLRGFIRAEVAAQLNSAGRGRRAHPATSRNARSQGPRSSRSNSRSRSGSRARSRSSTRSRVSFRSPNRRSAQPSRSSQSGRRAHGRTAAGSFGSGHGRGHGRGRGRSASRGRGWGNRGRGRRGRAPFRGRF